MFKIADELVKEDVNLEVIIIERLPRFDTKKDDPLKVKKELSEFANTVYKQEWIMNGSPKRIHIAKVQLGCESLPHLQQIIYGKSESDTFNGIQLHGEGAVRHLTYRTKQAINTLNLNCNLSNRKRNNADSHSKFSQPRRPLRAHSVRENPSLNNQNYGSNVYSIPVRNRFVGNF